MSGQVGAQLARYASGVATLNEANRVVAGMKTELKQLQPVLAAKKRETEALMRQAEGGEAAR